MFPGFIDAHMHVAASGLEHLKSVDTDLPSVAAIKDAIHKRAAETQAGDWVLGFKYDDTKMAEGRPSIAGIWMRPRLIIPCLFDIAAATPLRQFRRAQQGRR